MSDWKPERRTDLGTGPLPKGRTLRQQFAKILRPPRMIQFSVIDENGDWIDTVQAPSRAEARRVLIQKYAPTRARKLKLERLAAESAAERRAYRAEARQR